MSTTEARARKKKHVRKKIYGFPDRPRLSVFRSNSNIYAQIVNDTEGHTLVSASSLDEAIQSKAKKAKNKTELGKIVGEHLAEKAIESGIKRVVFDRNGYRYHGRVKALAEAAREGGLEF